MKNASVLPFGVSEKGHKGSWRGLYPEPLIALLAYYSFTSLLVLGPQESWPSECSSGAEGGTAEDWWIGSSLCRRGRRERKAAHPGIYMASGLHVYFLLKKKKKKKLWLSTRLLAVQDITVIIPWKTANAVWSYGLICNCVDSKPELAGLHAAPPPPSPKGGRGSKWDI